MTRTKLLFVAAAAILGSLCLRTEAEASDKISGVISRTYQIVEDTELVGDVTCEVTGAACFAFVAPGVELRLNGFTITGRADAITGCGGASTNGEAGINTNGMAGVSIRGPGMVQRFRGDGITVSGSQSAYVLDLTLSTNCMAGVRVLATAFGTVIEGNTAVRNGSTEAGFPCGGI